MVRSCSVPLCRSGIDGSDADLWRGRVTFYSFPRDEEVRSQWLEAIGRRAMRVTPHSAVCSLHFTEEDFVESNDSNLWRRRSKQRKGKGTNKRKWLRRGAVPSVMWARGEWETRLREITPTRSKRVKREAEEPPPPLPPSPSSLPHCLVSGCDNDVCDLRRGVAFFSIPSSSPASVRRWAKLCGHHPYDWQPPSLARLCSRHFGRLKGVLEDEEEVEGESFNASWDSLSRKVEVKAEEAEGASSSLIRILRAPDASIGREVRDFYQGGAFYDVEIVCGDGGGGGWEEGDRISCHGLFLAALSPLVKEALLTSHYSDSAKESFQVLLPDCRAGAVRRCVDALYACAAEEARAEEIAGDKEVREVLDTLGIDLNRPTTTARQGEESEDKLKVDKMEVECDYFVDEEGHALLNDDFEGVPSKKRRKRKRGRPPKSVKSEESTLPLRLWEAEEVESNVEQVRANVTQGSGSIRVELMEEPLNPSRHTHSAKRERSMFMCILGLKKDGAAATATRAVPLGWSPSAAEELTPAGISSQHAAFCSALRSVFGLSHMETHHQSQVFARMGVAHNPNASRMYYNLKRKYVCYTDDQLRSLLTEEVTAVHETGTAKSGLAGVLLSPGGERVLDLDLTSDLVPADVDDIVLVSFEQSGSAPAHFLSVGSEDTARAADVQQCIRAFFDVLCLGRQARDTSTRYPVVPACETILEEYRNLNLPAATYQVVTEFLKDKDGTKRKNLSGLERERQCEDCGRVFQMTTLNDTYAFNSHRRSHFFEKFECSCEVTWKTAAEKRAHVLLVHKESDGYVKCKECDFVAKRKTVERHEQTEHSPFTCEYCGEEIWGETNLRVHMKISHTELAAGDLKRVAKKKNQKTKSPFALTSHCKTMPPPCTVCGKTFEKPIQLYSHFRGIHLERKCPHCDFTGKGEASIKLHLRKWHPAEKDLPKQCEQCGKTLRDAKHLQIHVLAVHTPAEERPHPCDKCDRRFPSHARLWTHKKRAHQTDRPYVCRFGCGSGYKDPSDRSGHEKKAHGMSFKQFEAEQKKAAENLVA